MKCSKGNQFGNYKVLYKCHMPNHFSLRSIKHIGSFEAILFTKAISVESCLKATRYLEEQPYQPHRPLLW